MERLAFLLMPGSLLGEEAGLAFDCGALRLEGGLDGLNLGGEGLGLFHDHEQAFFVLSNLLFGESDFVEQRAILLVGFDVAGVGTELIDLGAEGLDVAVHLAALAEAAGFGRPGPFQFLAGALQLGFRRRLPFGQASYLNVQLTQPQFQSLDLEQDLKVSMHCAVSGYHLRAKIVAAAMERLGHLLQLLPHAAVGEANTDAAEELGPALAWTLAAGPALAGRAACRGLRGGVMRVEAGDETVQRQIESVAPELRRALNRMLGEGRVERLQFVEPSS